MSIESLLAELNLQEFQKRTVMHVHDRMFGAGQRRFLVADEVGLGKTKVAQGVMAKATAGRRRPNVLYVASSGHIVSQNLHKLKTKRLMPESFGSLCLLAETAYASGIEGKLIGLTPIKDLRSDHFGSVRERALLYNLLMRRHRSLMAESAVYEFFKGSRANSEIFDRYAEGSLPGAMRDDFERQLDANIIEQLRDPQLRKKHKRAIVGKLRALLAKCTLQKLNPVMIVVDEIQRFSDSLLTDTPTPQVGFLLKRPILVLSATPYQPGVPGDHSSKEPHKGFMELVEFLNPDRPDDVEKVKRALLAMRTALLANRISKPLLQQAVEDLGNHLRNFMVRTERPFDAHVERIAVDADIDGADLGALRQAMNLLKKAAPSAKNRHHRFAELVELWKSVPYVAGALSSRYVTGKGFAEVLRTRTRMPTPATLSFAQLYRSVPLGEPAHARLRAMIREMGSDAIQRRLWVPPARPYVEAPFGVQDEASSKTLVFTSWGAAPAAIATALNLFVEPRPGRKRDLDFVRTNKLDGQNTPVRSVYLLGAPLWRFAEGSDPFEAMRGAGKALPASKLIAQVRAQLSRAGCLDVSRAARSKNFVDLALGLNARPSYPMATAQTASHMTPARELMDDVVYVDRVKVASAHGDDLAELAAAAPGTCAYRALRRAIPELEKNRPALFGAAIAIGASITRLFQRPGAVAIVEGARSSKKTPYWRKVLRFCLENDLQSVLDEYVFLLVRDSSEKDPGKLADEVAQTIQVALSTVGGLHVAHPKAKPKAPYGAAMYARALGEHDTPEDGELKEQKKSATGNVAKKPIRKKGGHANPLLTAFNSPFPPFVLTTTSTGQEGLDMHRYCRRLVHWNLPNSPLALEQREGRVDRYLSLGVRTNIAKLDFPLSGTQPLAHPWGLLLQAAEARTSQHSSILAPLWHFGEGQPIKAIAFNVPFSKEETAWKRLLEEASWYRLVLGQPDPHALLERLSNASAHNRLEIAGVRIDLTPRVPAIKESSSRISLYG